MTKRKVVEDSDDDENAEASPPHPLATGLSDITLSPLVSLNSSPLHEIQEQSGDPSTSSSELLNREARAAHKSLVEPTPKSTHPTIGKFSSSQQQTPTSPTASRLKMKRSKTSIEKPKAKKPLKTYGKSSQDIFEFHGGSDGELDTTRWTDLGHNPEKPKSNDRRRIDRAASRRGSQDEAVARNPINSSSGDTELPRNEPKRHEMSSPTGKEGSLRSSMPPPTSKSTSFDQSQLLQADNMHTITDPAPPKSATSNALPSAIGTYSEVRSVDRMSAPTRFSGGEINQERARALRPNETTRRVDLQPTEGPASNSSASETSPNKTITIERIDRIQIVGNDLNSHLGSKQYLDSPLDPSVSTVNPAVLQPASTDTEGAQDELSPSIPEAAIKNVAKHPKATKRRMDADDEPLDELGSDDNALGVAKEHYQPRPSTRRSGGGDAEIVVPTDFSKRPEAIGKGKRKIKRHKTTAFQELLPKDEDEDEEIKVVPDPRFEIPEKKTPKTFAESDQPDVKRSGNTEEIRPEAQLEPNQTAKSTGQKKRGRPKKAVTNLSEETVVDEAETDHDQNGAEIEQQVISATAKKSRKRTRTRETAMPIMDEQDSNTTSAPAAQDDSEAPSANANILNETNGNMNPPKLTNQSPPNTSPIKANAPPETPSKSTTPAPKGPDKHSPISTGKVSYRVGLSKRARIAPLLRIVRK